MPKNINSAYRVYSILSNACENQSNESMWQVFAKVFRVHNPNGRKLLFEIIRLIDLFYDEVDKTRRQMEASNFSPDLYESAFKTLEERITPSLIYNEWAGYRRDILPVLPTIKFCSEVLPNEEELINQEDLDAIEQVLQQLEAKLQDSDLSDQAKTFIRHQIGLIRKAMRDYKIVGIQVFKTAVYEGYVDYLANEEIVAENENKEEIGLLRKAWTGAKKVANLTIKAEKLLTAGSKLYEMGEKAVDQIDKLT